MEDKELREVFGIEIANRFSRYNVSTTGQLIEFLKEKGVIRLSDGNAKLRRRPYRIEQMGAKRWTVIFNYLRKNKIEWKDWVGTGPSEVTENAIRAEIGELMMSIQRLTVLLTQYVADSSK